LPLEEYVPVKNVGQRKRDGHTDRCEIWDFLLASLRGGMGMQGRTGLSEQQARDIKPSGYYAGLTRWRAENIEDYIKRVADTPYRPYARRIVKAFANYVCQHNPDRNNVENFGELVEDANLRGDDMTSFVRDVVVLWRCLGVMNILIDMPDVGETPPASKREQQDRKIRPYAIPVLPQDVVDYDYNLYGQYRWALIRGMRTNNDPDNDDPKTIETRTYWDAMVWQRYEERKDNKSGTTWELVASGEHKCGFTPLIRIVDTDIDSNPVTPESWFYDLADLNRAIYSLESVDLQNFARQCFGQLILPASTEDETKTASISEAWTETVEENGISRYIQTDGAEHDKIEAKIISIRQEMYRVAGLLHRTDSKAAESAEAKQWDHQEMNQFLAATARGCDRIETEIYRAAAAWNGKRGESNAEVTYPKDFSIEDIREIIESALDLKTIGWNSETGRKEVLKKIYDLILDMSPDIRAAIEKEIDESADDPMGGYDMTREPSQTTGELVGESDGSTLTGGTR